jgi:hypothetical protein
MANDSLSQLSDALGIATARLSGDPQRMQMALGMQQSRKLQEEAAARQQQLEQLARTNPSFAKMYQLFGEKGLQQAYLQEQQEQKQSLQLKQQKENLKTAGLSDTEINLYLSAGMDVKDILELRKDVDLDKTVSQLDEEVIESKGIVSEGLKNLDEAFGLADTIQTGLAKGLGPVSPIQIAPTTTAANTARKVLNERIREKFVSEYTGRPSVYLNTRIDALLPQSTYLTELEAKQQYEEVKRVLVEGVDELKTKIESGIYEGENLLEAQEQYKDIQSIVKDLDVGINALSGDNNYESIYLPSN